LYGQKGTRRKEPAERKSEKEERERERERGWLAGGQGGGRTSIMVRWYAMLLAVVRQRGEGKREREREKGR
jgi:hypothetical protein